MIQRTLTYIAAVFFITQLSACATTRIDRDIYSATPPDHGTPKVSVWGERNVAWLERGNPKGFPVFYAHGNPGSRLELLFLDQKAKEYDVRLIAIDRPGLGQSDYVADYDLLDFASDIERLADEQGIQQFGLLGWSSGGPPVLAVAHHLPKRAKFAISVSGYTNFGELDNARELMKRYDLRGPEMSKERPKLFNQAVKLIRWTDITLPNFYMKMAEAEMADYDRNILEDKHVADIFMRNQEEALQQGIKGTIQDLEVQWAPWGFSLTDINVPVYIFQGQKDTFVPWKFAEHMAKTIPNAELHLKPDAGHLIPLDPVHQDEIFSIILKHAE
ncbi:alpha/beta fold hydrolase [Alkalimarinus alittae]|uniref:Alpha/beta hydrolase n=1 Tax=Alkalimarinus alittae TaxID=2961619 RepID=A0ABY6N308_9ALTE|nr:alpha/beta hydrolase [Alkalimarinus alittae]UZE96503.1 alpha/beta hydrolase [Alkalimarinus alittae]